MHASLAPIELSFGYRRLNYKQDDIDLLMPGLTVFLPFNLWLTERCIHFPTRARSLWPLSSPGDRRNACSSSRPARSAPPVNGSWRRRTLPV